MSKLYDLLSAMCGKIKKPDWNQNDATAADYVKNRPFYTDNPVETVLVEEQTVTVGDDLYISLSDSVTFVEGETYAVTYNGVQYECVAWAANALDYAAIIVGNGEVYGGDGGNGEPFALEYDFGKVYLNVADPGEYTVSISCMLPKVHKIENKYLPEGTIVVPKAVSKYAVSCIDLSDFPLGDYTFGEVVEDGGVDSVELPTSKWDELFEAVSGASVIIASKYMCAVSFINTETRNTFIVSGNYIRSNNDDILFNYVYLVCQYSVESGVLTFTRNITSGTIS